MSLQGQIEDLGVAELLYMVGIARRSGLLHLDGGGGEHELLFRNGRIVAARDRKAPGSLRGLLIQAQLVDETHLAVLERQAARSGRPLGELLAEEGLVAGPALEAPLRSEVERALGAALALRDGRFSFELVADADASVDERFGGLVLADGLDPSKLPAVAERSGGGLSGLGTGVSLPRSEAGRRVELLVDDSSISLPLLPPSSAGVRPPDERPAAETDRAAGRPHVLLAIGWTELGRRLQARLEGGSTTVLRPRSVAEAAERVTRLAGAGAPITLVADSSLSALPGAELLARVKLASRGARVVLLLDRRGTPAQLAAHRERAAQLGATHVVLLPPGESEAEAEAAERELLELLEPDPSPAEPPAIQGLADMAEPAPDWPAGEGAAEGAPLLADLGVEAQDARLATLLRELLHARASAELALELLEVAGEYAPRATLWLKTGENSVRAFGVAAASPDLHARLARALPLLRLPAPEADLPCACLRDGKSRRVPAALAGAGLAAALGEPAADQVAALPLLGPEGPVACLLLDDAGETGRLAALDALERFAAGVAAPLAEALARDARRAEARRLRARA